MTAMPIYGPEVQRKPVTPWLPMSREIVAHLRIADPEYRSDQQRDPSSSCVIGPCKDCGRTMVKQAPYKRIARWRERGYVKASGHGMCNGCYSRAYRWGTLPDPAPRQQRTWSGRIHAPVPYDVLGLLLLSAPLELKDAVEARVGIAVVVRAIELARVDQSGGGS